ncbi:MAG TPA: nucleotidyltransferase domain-containing protein [Gemmatimonadales bacterium]|nr:nucleotidyltransferase domain-containing protein [Gemmatimonadales bacterium]
MIDAVERVVTPFLAGTDAALGPGYSAILFGSAARGDFVPGRSDIDLMLVAADLAPATLRALAGPFETWRRSEYEPPLVVTRSEWERASDAFPVELADMQACYRVLRGPDLLAGQRVEPGHLRVALEREFRGKLLRLRQGYVASANDPAALGALAGRSAGSLMVLFRALLVLLGRSVPRDPLQLGAAGAEVLGVEGEPLLHVIRHRAERGWRCTAEEFERYMEMADRAVRFLDQLQLGELR